MAPVWTPLFGYYLSIEVTLTNDQDENFRWLLGQMSRDEVFRARMNEDFGTDSEWYVLVPMLLSYAPGETEAYFAPSTA